MKEMGYYREMVQDEDCDFEPGAEPAAAYYCEKCIGAPTVNDNLWIFPVSRKESDFFGISLPYYSIYFCPDGFVYGHDMTIDEYDELMGE